MNNTTGTLQTAIREYEYDELPRNVKDLIAEFDERYENEDTYPLSEELLSKAKLIGWKFDYGLDGIPTDWKPLN